MLNSVAMLPYNSPHTFTRNGSFLPDLLSQQGHELGTLFFKKVSFGYGFHHNHFSPILCLFEPFSSHAAHLGIHFFVQIGSNSLPNASATHVKGDSTDDDKYGKERKTKRNKWLTNTGPRSAA